MVREKDTQWKTFYNPEVFSEALFEKMKQIDPAIRDLELYEFRYGLKNITPAEGWQSVHLEQKEEIEARVNSRSFYDSIQIKPRLDDRIVLDDQIISLTDMLFVGLVTGLYDDTWIRRTFLF